MPLRTTARLAAEVCVAMCVPISVSSYRGRLKSVATDGLRSIKGFGEVAESIGTPEAPTPAGGHLHGIFIALPFSLR